MSFRKEPLTLAGRTSLCAALILMSAGISQAQITGKIWEGDASNNADTVPVGTPSMTFSSSAVNYGDASDASISTFMNYSGTVTTFGNIQSGSSPSDSSDDIHVQLTGQIYLTAGANSFGVGHDDGLRINVTGIGTVLDTPGPTGFVLTPFNITAPSTGNYTFVLDYNECCGPPAYLEWAFPSGIPITGHVPDAGLTMGLLGAGLAALGVFGRRMRK